MVPAHFLRVCGEICKFNDESAPHQKVFTPELSDACIFFWEASEIKNVVSGFLYYLERPCESFIKGYKRHSFFSGIKAELCWIRVERQLINFRKFYFY